MSIESDYIRVIERVTWVSVVVNLLLTIIKIIFGLALHSISLVSDGLHSLSDIITDFIVWVGAKLGNRPADSDHHFGHGKYETFAELVLALFIIVPAGSIIWYSIVNIKLGVHSSFHWSVFITALISVIVKEYLFQWTRKLASQINSQVLLANAWHHRSDAFSSFIVIVGSILTFIGIPYSDAVAGIIIGLLIAITGLKFLKRGLMELSESTPGKELEKKVHGILNKVKGVKSYHRIRIRKQGSYLMMDMHIMVDSKLDIKTAHDISTNVELSLKNSLGYNTTNVLVHVEPFEGAHKDL